MLVTKGRNERLKFMKLEEDFQAWFLYKCCVCGNWFHESEIREPSFRLHPCKELNKSEFIAYNEMEEFGFICKKCYEQESTTFHEIKQDQGRCLRMKFKEFVDWCETRIMKCDYSSGEELKKLIEYQKIIFEVKKRPIWRRNWFWETFHEPKIVKEITQHKMRK